MVVRSCTIEICVFSAKPDIAIGAERGTARKPPRGGLFPPHPCGNEVGVGGNGIDSDCDLLGRVTSRLRFG